jgi:hypothetical protein
MEIASAPWRSRDPFGDHALIKAGGLQFGGRHGGIDTHRGPFTIPFGVFSFSPADR